MMTLIYGSEPNGLASFLLLSLVLAGASSYATGRALALVWQPFWQAILYVVLLTAVERFLHFALFHETLWVGSLWAVDYGLNLAIAVFAYCRTRARQMARHYAFLTAEEGVGRQSGGGSA